MFIREMLLRERNEVTDECMRNRRIGSELLWRLSDAMLCSLRSGVGGVAAQAGWPAARRAAAATGLLPSDQAISQ